MTKHHKHKQKRDLNEGAQALQALQENREAAQQEKRELAQHLSVVRPHTSRHDAQDVDAREEEIERAYAQYRSQQPEEENATDFGSLGLVLPLRLLQENAHRLLTLHLECMQAAFSLWADLLSYRARSKQR